jgi:hypothetical protein
MRLYVYYNSAFLCEKFNCYGTSSDMGVTDIGVFKETFFQPGYLAIAWLILSGRNWVWRCVAVRSAYTTNWSHAAPETFLSRPNEDPARSQNQLRSLYNWPYNLQM